jgi:hypothetical protein
MSDFLSTKLASGSMGGHQFTVGNCLSMLVATPPRTGEPPVDVRDWLIKLLENRFRQRFFAPVESILGAPGCERPEIKTDGRGFAVMAVCGLTVEVLACLITGQWTTYWGGEKSDPRWQNKSSPAPLSRKWKPAGGKWHDAQKAYSAYGLYGDLLLELSHEDGTLLFDGNKVLAEKFYKSIRCGLLHQAETGGGWKIGATKGKGIIQSPPKVDAPLFFESLKRRFKSHIDLLEVCGYDSAEWLACRYKLLGICRASGWETNEHDGVTVDFRAYWP